MNLMAQRWCKLYRGTPAEHSLEPAIAALGVPYRTQYPLFLFGRLRYFPDFVLLNERIIIEVDDPSHDRPAKVEDDRKRTDELKGAGWTVLRCTNEEALHSPFRTVQRLANKAGLGHLINPTDARFQVTGRPPTRIAPEGGTTPQESSFGGDDATPTVPNRGVARRK